MIEAAPMWGIIELLVLLAFCVCGVPIAFSLGVVGLGFAWLYYGGGGASISLVAITTWGNLEKYTMTMIPLFVLMGEVVGQAGIGADAYNSVYKFAWRLKGSIAITATIACAIFGAITGSTIAATATIGGISYPEMKKRGYSSALALGSLANAGILASLIPPSILAILYCVLVEESVGRVFIGGIIPGVILTIIFSIIIYMWVTLRPDAAPISKEHFTWKERLASLRGPFPILAVFLIMIIGIYTGLFTPTEAGGVGAFLALTVVLIMKRLTWQGFIKAMTSTLRITAMVMLIILGAMLYMHTLAITGVSSWVGGALLSLPIPKLSLMFIIIGLIILCGCVMDVFAIMVLFIPLFYPLVVEMGYDPVWYGVLTVTLLGMAIVTPPIAINLYVAHSLDPKVTLMHVAKGCMPFYFGGVILLILLVFFPQLATWLPSMMIGG